MSSKLASMYTTVHQLFQYIGYSTRIYDIGVHLGVDGQKINRK